MDCSADFSARDFAHVEYHDKKGELRRAYEMTKDGFMFLVMGFTGKKAAQIKEAYIKAFNQMAHQLRSAVPSISHQQNQLSVFSRLPCHYESGWITACYQRSPYHVRCAWVHHVRIKVYPHPRKDKFCGEIILGIGGEGEPQPEHTTESGMYRGGSYYYEFRMLDELWENIRDVVSMLNAVSPF